MSKIGTAAQLSFSPDERFLLSSNWDNRDPSQPTIGGTPGQLTSYLSYKHDWAIWDLATGTLLRNIILPQTNLGNARFSYDGRLLIATGAAFDAPNTGVRPQERRLLIWETATGNRLGEMPMPQSGCSYFALSADGHQAAVPLPDGTIWICDFSKMLRPLLIARDPGDSPPVAELWKRLASSDPVVAYRAINRLCEQPDAAVRFIGEQLLPDAAPFTSTAPAKPPAPKETTKLIKDLESDDPAVMRAASSRLLALGPAAQADIRVALAQNLPQRVQSRLNLILVAGASSTKTADPPSTPTSLQQLRAVQVLEQIANPVARKLLKASAALPAAQLSAEAGSALRRLETQAISPP